MKIYIDSGNLDEIEKAVETKLVDGVTTNPSLVMKQGIDFKLLIQKISDIFKKNNIKEYTISAEVVSKEIESMIKEAKQIAKIDSHVIIKVPLTKIGLIVVKKLNELGIRTNVTLCFSSNQALLAAKAGAYIISPFEGRLDDVGEDGSRLVQEIRDIYDNYNYETKILAASIRSPKQVKEAALIGADIVTLPFSVFEKLFFDPLTDIGLQKFDADWEKYKESFKND